MNKSLYLLSNVFNIKKQFARQILPLRQAQGNSISTGLNVNYSGELAEPELLEESKFSLSTLHLLFEDQTLRQIYQKIHFAPQYHKRLLS